MAETFCLNICLLFCVSGVINLLVGKQVIHPNQITVVQEQFSPSPEKIKWAEELIAAFKEHQQLGKVNILLMPWIKLMFKILWRTILKNCLNDLKKNVFWWEKFVLGRQYSSVRNSLKVHLPFHIPQYFTNWLSSLSFSSFHKLYGQHLRK